MSENEQVLSIDPPYAIRFRDELTNPVHVDKLETKRDGIGNSPTVPKRTSDNISSATTDAISRPKKSKQLIPGNREGNDIDTQDELNENAIAPQDDGYYSAASVSPPKTVVNSTHGNSEINVNRDHLNFNGNQHTTNGDHLHVGQLLHIHGNVNIFHGVDQNESLPNWNAESSQKKMLEELKELTADIFKKLRENQSGTDNADKDNEHENSLKTEVCNAQDPVEGGIDLDAASAGLAKQEQMVKELKVELKELRRKVRSMTDSADKHDQHGNSLKPEVCNDFSAACFESPAAASYDGMLVWKIPNFSQLKQDALSGKDVSLFSQPFYSSRHGYKMCAQLCLDVDDGGMGKEVNASLSFVIMPGENDAVMPWPFKQKVTLMLLDQDTGQHHLSHSFQPDPNSSFFKRPTTDMNVASGCPLYIDHKVLEEDSPYLKDDVIFVKVVVDTTGVDGSNARLVSVENQMGMHAVHERLAEYESRLQVLETANYEGVLLWKIKDFARRKRDADSSKTSSLYSQPFYTSRYGYKMCARINLNGDGMGKKKHASLFFVIMRGDYDALLSWPFKQKVTLMLLDQDTGQRHISKSFQPNQNSSFFKRPTTDMNVASGCPLYIDHKVLEEDSPYLKDDVIFVKVVVDTEGISGT